MEAVLAFAKQVSARGAGQVAEAMRNYAFQFLDWQVKMARYLEFVQGL
jgi:hypothetical protein